MNDLADKEHPVFDGPPRPVLYSVYAWLGYWRDHIPIKAVTELQNILGPLPTDPAISQ